MSESQTEGLSKRERVAGNHVFLQIFKGEFRQKVKEGTEGAVSRQNKNDVTVWELANDCLIGRLTDIAVKLGAFGKELHLEILAGGKSYLVQTTFNSGYAYGFLSRMVNIDLEKPLTLLPYYIEKKDEPGKFSSVMVVNQDGVKVPSNYTKENPNGCPPLKEVTFKGQKAWDDTERSAFFEGLLFMGEDAIARKVQRLNVSEAVASQETVETETPTLDLESSDIENDVLQAETTKRKRK